MTTVLFADRDGAALGPLGARTIPALLPLGGKPLLERALEALVAAGRRSALVVVGPRAAEVEARFGKGIRWGIALEWVRREDGESPADVLRRLEARLDGETIALRGDAGTHGSIGAFLEACEGRDEPVLAGDAGGRFSGHVRVAPGALKKLELPREPADEGWTAPKGSVPVPLESEAVLVDALASYRAADRAEAGTSSATSDRAVVESAASLGPGSTVAEEAVVLAGSRLTATTVLPRSVIPPGVSLDGKIVSGDLVVDPVTGGVTRLSDLLPPPRPWRAGAGDRAVALGLLVLSLPLWPVAFVWSLVANAGRATGDVRLAGVGAGTNGSGGPARETFATFRFETAVPVLRDLPLLLAVVRGALALTGVTALTPEEEAGLSEPRDRVRFEAPPALLSTARLVAPGGSPPEVFRMLDAFDARRATGGVFRRAASALFDARGWTARRAWNPDTLPDGKLP